MSITHSRLIGLFCYPPLRTGWVFFSFLSGSLRHIHKLTITSFLFNSVSHIHRHAPVWSHDRYIRYMHTSSMYSYLTCFKSYRVQRKLIFFSFSLLWSAVWSCFSWSWIEYTHVDVGWEGETDALVLHSYCNFCSSRRMQRNSKQKYMVLIRLIFIIIYVTERFVLFLSH